MLDFNLLGMGGLNPLQMAAKGYEQGADIQQNYQKQQALQQAAIEKKQNELDEEAILAKAIEGDVKAQAQYALKFAKDATEAQSSLAMLDKPKREARRTMAYQWDSLARTNPAALRDIVKQRIVALENSEPTQETQQELATLKSMQLLDDSKLPMATLPMIAVSDPDGYGKYIEPIIKQQEQPLKMRELGAKAEKAETEAKVAPEIANLDIVSKRLSNEKEVLDNQIKKLEAQGYLTPTQQADLDEKRARIAKISYEIGTAQDKKISDLSSEIETQRGSIQSSQDVIHTANKLLNHAGFAGVFGASSYLPTVAGTDAADASAILEQIQSQSFMASVDNMRGLGALTESEGKKLTSAIANIKENMSEKAAKQSLNEIITIMARGKTKAEAIIKKNEQKLKPLRQTAAQSTFDDLNSKY